MADLTRAEELVQAIDGDAAFRSEVEAATTVGAKRQMLDARGYQDVTLDDMRAYVESKGGTLVAKDSGRELSEQELAAVAGGITGPETQMIVIGSGIVALGAAAAAA